MVSRVAKIPITVPPGLEVKIQGQELTLKGKLGQLSRHIHPAVTVSLNNNQLHFEPTQPLTPEANALAGASRALVNAMVQGVMQGFTCKLVLVGVGYRAKAQGNTLNLAVGFSHSVDITMPEGVKVETPSNTEIVIKGTDKQQVFQTAANVRAVRPPEPYQGKGIRKENERIILKEAKKK